MRRLAVFVIALGCAPLAFSQVAVIEPYYENDVARVEPPPGVGLIGFPIPVHQGLLRLGQQNDYGIPQRRNEPEIHRTLAQRQEGGYNKRKGAQLYLGLIALAENAEDFPVPALRDAFIGGDGFHNAQYAPGYLQRAMHFLHLLRGTLDDAEYRRLLCSEGAPCPLDRFKGMRPFWIEGYKVTPYFGAAKNGFRMRAAYQEAVTSHARQLSDWGAALSRRVYMVSSADASYDFGRKAYKFTFSPHSPMTVDAPRRTAKGATLTYNSVQPGYAQLEVLVPMAEPRAESLYNRQRESVEKRMRPPLVVYEARLTHVGVERGMQRPMNQLLVEHVHVITGNRFEFYFDEALSEPMMTVELAPL